MRPQTKVLYEDITDRFEAWCGVAEAAVRDTKPCPDLDALRTHIFGFFARRTLVKTLRRELQDAQAELAANRRELRSTQVELAANRRALRSTQEQVESTCQELWSTRAELKIVSQELAALKAQKVQPSESPGNEGLRRGEIKELIKVCHPDKWQNHRVATELTKALTALLEKRDTTN